MRLFASTIAPLLLLLLLQLCSIATVSAQLPADYSPDNRQWLFAWVSGSTASNYAGNYGTLGVGTNETFPARRSDASEWTYIDPDTGEVSLYVYSGTLLNNLNPTLRDLWVYNTSSEIWTWIDGSATPSTTALPGTPGPRIRCQTWVEGTRLYLHGGRGPSSTFPNDVWYYDVRLANWTQVSTGSGTPDCATNVLGGRAGAVIWRIPVDPVDAGGLYGVHDYWLFGGVTTTTNSALANLWRWNSTGQAWQCIQQYPTVNQTIGVDYRNFSASDPTACYPGVEQATPPGPQQIAIAGTAWVYNSTFLIYQQDRQRLVNFTMVLLGYSITANRWAPVSSAGDIIPAYPRYGNTHPSLPYMGWTGYNVGPNAETLLYAANAVRYQYSYPFFGVWTWSYERDQWYWQAGVEYEGGMSASIVFNAFLGPYRAYSEEYSFGSRGRASMWSISLPYSIPGYAAGDASVYIGFGRGIGATTGRADLWHLAPFPEPVITPPSSTEPPVIRWAWLGGNAGTESVGVYQTEEPESLVARPTPRVEQQSWTYVPADGSPTLLYVYGGITGVNASATDLVDAGSQGAIFADMWMFNTSSQRWSWLGGPAEPSLTRCCQNTTWPGTVWRAQTWVMADALYMYGGRPAYTSNAEQATSELWRYSVTSGNWTFLGFLGPSDSPSSTSGANCSANIIGKRSAGAVWQVYIPGSSNPGNVEVYIYGGAWIFLGAGSNAWETNNMWRWNHQQQNFECIQDFPVASTVASGPFRDFSASIPASANYPASTGFFTTWVYSRTILVTAVSTDTTLWGFSTATRRWAVISLPGATLPSYPPSSPQTPGAQGVPEASQLVLRRTGWVDYSLFDSGEPALILMGTQNGTGPSALFTSPASRYNLWAYSYIDDAWYWYGGTVRRALPAAYAPQGVSSTSANPGSRVSPSVFDGENVRYQATGKTPAIYIGLGAPMVEAYGVPGAPDPPYLYPLRVIGTYLQIPGYNDVWKYDPEYPVRPAPASSFIIVIAVIGSILGVGIIGSLVFFVVFGRRDPAFRAYKSM